MTNADNESLVDVYRCYNDQDVVRLRQLLEDEQLEVIVRDHGSSAFPTNVGSTGEQVIAVAERDLDKARTLITQAIEDEIISHEGALV